MTVSTDSRRATGRPRRLDRPERIALADDTLLRNDLVAKEQGTSERTVNRMDAHGAPHILIGGVKYRPIKQYREYLASQIQRSGQPPKRRKRAQR